MQSYQCKCEQKLALGTGKKNLRALTVQVPTVVRNSLFAPHLIFWEVRNQDVRDKHKVMVRTFVFGQMFSSQMSRNICGK